MKSSILNSHVKQKGCILLRSHPHYLWPALYHSSLTSTNFISSTYCISTEKSQFFQFSLEPSLIWCLGIDQESRFWTLLFWAQSCQRKTNKKNIHASSAFDRYNKYAVCHKEQKNPGTKEQEKKKKKKNDWIKTDYDNPSEIRFLLKRHRSNVVIRQYLVKKWWHFLKAKLTSFVS